MPASTIITMLTSDHRTVAKLFSQLEKTTTRSARKRHELFAELDHALSVHADFEESDVYPLLEKQKSSKSIALEAVEEHIQVKRLLAELRTLDPHDDVWTAKVTVLMENVRHHVKEEEGDALPKLRQAVTTEELKRIGAIYAAVKARGPQPVAAKEKRKPKH